MRISRIVTALVVVCGCTTVPGGTSAATALTENPTLTATSPAATVWVAVTGPRDWQSPEELVLEVAETSWLGDGGVVVVQAGQALPVRLVGRMTCIEYTSFVAPPGTNWVIRFTGDGSLRVEDSTGRPMDSGPALPEREASGCPRPTYAPTLRPHPLLTPTRSAQSEPPT